MGTLIAAADIGSNTAHLLIADASAKGVRRIVNESDWLSLGEVVSRTGDIPAKDQDSLIRTLRRFQQVSTAHKVQHFYLFATEAVRRAANHKELLGRIKDEVGLEVDVISPRREAELGLRGAMMDCPGDWPALMVEAGGGSVQVALCDDGRVAEDASLAIGTGVLIASAGLTQPATSTQLHEMRQLIDRAIEEVADFGHVKRIIASGGVARGVWRALHADGERAIDARELEYLAWDSARLNQDRIVARYGVKQRRALTLLPGATIYASVMAAFGHSTMTVSELGVREGAVAEIFEGRLEPCRSST